MGLDISAYSNVKLIDCVFNEHGSPIDPITREELPWDSYTQVYKNDYFQNHGEGLDNGKVYSFEESISFRAGSYSGYNA